MKITNPQTILLLEKEIETKSIESLSQYTQKMKTTKVYKKAFNRGQARIWIEGSILISHGLYNGLRFTKERIDDDELLLSFAASFPEGIKSNKIAGTLDRPIIDMTGKWLTEFFGDAEKYTCQFDEETKTITIIRGGLV